METALLAADGFAATAMERGPPDGAAEDDVLDALACLAIARRVHSGIAEPFPNPPLRDDFGLPVAIWA
jgi:predicted RNase H-like nuclease